jgi:hypothetical protein
MEYLEGGSWKGSTICSALYSNPDCNGTVIENWSLFGGPREEFNKNCINSGIGDRLTVHEHDLFSFDISNIKTPIDIYLYDGSHSEIDQYRGITHMWPALADEATILIDDWNWKDVRKGTLDGLRDVGATIIEQIEIMHVVGDEGHTPLSIARREFWNGIGIFVVSKSSAESQDQMQR